MKHQVLKLRKIKNIIIKTVEKRDEVSLKRSDEWCESQKGKDFETKTGQLADSVDGILEAIKQIESFLE